ncbi:MAG: DUF4435 domain-containing protein, partial [Sphingobacteriaceae bacterium]
TIDVYPSNYFEETNPGCQGVISCIEALQPRFLERAENLEKLLGIIDKDSRFYRNDMRDDLLGLFITKYYSIETYFVNDKNIRHILSKVTYATKSDFNEDVIELIKTNFDALIQDLYVISLEALKNACEIGYSSVVGYDYSEAKVTEQGSRTYYLSLLELKKDELQSFALEKNVSIADIKLIAKGKWFIYAFAYVISKSIAGLKTKCRDGVIVQCKSCIIGNYDDCLMNAKQSSYKPEAVRDMALEYLDLDELIDIVTAINKLK